MYANRPIRLLTELADTLQQSYRSAEMHTSLKVSHDPRP
jgi:hypothetical protein